MKIFTRTVIDMETLQIVESESIEHHGPIALCGGGGGGKSVPKVTPPPPPPEPKKEPDKEAGDARRDARERASRAAGLSATQQTGGRGLLDEAPTERKTLLGQ